MFGVAKQGWLNFCLSCSRKNFVLLTGFIEIAPPLERSSRTSRKNFLYYQLHVN